MLKPSLIKKLQSLKERFEEISALLSDAKTIENQNAFRELSKEYAQLEPVVSVFARYEKALKSWEEAKALLEEDDFSFHELAKHEIKTQEEAITECKEALQLLLLPSDPHDNSNIFLEIRAGTGGDEAGIFAGDLARMYTRYAETSGFKVEMTSMNPSGQGGYREIILRILGVGAYSRFKFESGVHRVQRVPETEAQGRVHTSTCTIAVMPEVDEIEAFDINPQDLRIDTFRASGAGGQHVQKTDSAIRITYLPTGLVVECQDERSQHKNRARAMSLLQAKLLASKRSEQKREQAETRRNLVGSGDRSERIRTYNFPQGRLTDHRINLTLYQLTDIMEGKLSPVIDVLIHEHQADLLALIGES